MTLMLMFSWSYGQKTRKQSNHFLRNRVILMLRSITFASVEKRKRCGDVEDKCEVCIQPQLECYEQQR